jgi:hypothetical protein
MAFTLQQLSDLEEIKQLKHRYFRCIDTGNEAELATLFTDDVTIDLRGGGYRLQVKGRKEMVEFIASSFNSDVIAQHHGHSPEIAFVNADEATGLRLDRPFIVIDTCASRAIGRSPRANMTGSTNWQCRSTRGSKSPLTCWHRPAGSRINGSIFHLTLNGLTSQTDKLF